MTTWFTLRANSALVADEWMKQINAAQVCRRERREGEGREEGGREEGGSKKGGRKGNRRRERREEREDREMGREGKEGWMVRGRIYRCKKVITNG